MAMDVLKASENKYVKAFSKFSITTATWFSGLLLCCEIPICMGAVKYYLQLSLCNLSIIFLKPFPIPAFRQISWANPDQGEKLRQAKREYINNV